IHDLPVFNGVANRPLQEERGDLSLDHIIGGPSSGSFQINLAISRTSQQDNRHLAVLLYCLVQKFEPITLAEPVIKQADIMLCLEDRFQTGLVSCHRINRICSALNAPEELASDEHILVIIFNQKYFNYWS